MGLIIDDNGRVTFTNHSLDHVLPDGAITNAKVASGAGIVASKLEANHRNTVAQAGTAATETKVIAHVRGTSGTLRDLVVTCVTACDGASTVTVDLKKNGTTVLGSVVTLDNSKAAYSTTQGTFSNASVSQNDVLTVVITANQVGTPALATGVAATLKWDEDYS